MPALSRRSHMVRLAMQERCYKRPATDREVGLKEERDRSPPEGIRNKRRHRDGRNRSTILAAIKRIDAERRSCIRVPISQDGRVVDSQGYMLDLEDE